MNYNEIFVVNKVFFKELKENEKIDKNKFELDNYDYYKPKLEDDFYLKQFISNFLFDIDILNVKEFLEFHYDNCKDPDNFLNVVEYKVLTISKDIISNTQELFGHHGYYNQINLEDDFVETEGKIKCYKYDIPFFNQSVNVKKNKAELLKRIDILNSFLEKLLNVNKEIKEAPLKWLAGSAQLGFIISKLIENGYIEPPTTQSKRGNQKGKLKTNHSQLARDVLTAFKIPGQGSEHTLKAYLNTESIKNIEIGKSFHANGFLLPNHKDLD